MARVTVAQLRTFLDGNADDDLIDVGLHKREDGYIHVEIQVVDAESHDILDLVDIADTYILPE